MPELTIAFPSDLFDPRVVDASFGEEYEAALAAGLRVTLLDQAAMDAGDWSRAVHTLLAARVLYRGWMLSAAAYASLVKALRSADSAVVISPEAYTCCHHLPSSYSRIESRTPRSVWVACDGKSPDALISECVRRASEFGNGSLVIKDYVKSRKHEWAEACFVPDAGDVDQLRTVLSNFVERQGEWLAGGVVLRQYVPFARAEGADGSGWPSVREWRTFWFDGKPMIQGAIRESQTSSPPPIDAEIESLLRKIPSPFFSADVAIDQEGRQWIVELGDGQVAGLLGTISPVEFYRALAHAA